MQPGEVLELDDSSELLQMLWNTGLVEITLDPPTRPLDYENYNVARMCSPTFRSRGPDEDRDAELAREKVHAELTGGSVEAVEAPKRSLASALTEATAGLAQPKKPTQTNRRRGRRRGAEHPNAEVSA